MHMDRNGTETVVATTAMATEYGHASVPEPQQRGLGSWAAHVSLEKHGNSGAYAKSQMSFTCFMDLLPGSTRADAAAILSTDDRNQITHSELERFILESGHNMVHMGVRENTRIGIVVPNGPEAGVAVICAMSLGICFPMNWQNTAEEIFADIQDCKIPVVLLHVAKDDMGREDPQSLSYKLSSAGVIVIEITPDEEKCGIFAMQLSSYCQTKQLEKEAAYESLIGNVAQVHRKYDTEIPVVHDRPRHAWVLVLHTSGTSGNKKCVPYTLETIAVGAACVISSWALKEHSVCFNMMPLFHIGGILRNLLAPIFSGGATVLAPGFDPVLFWNFVPKLNATWYYAAPTMHAMILSEVEKRGTIPEHKVELIGNAAGPLIPTLAERLKETFGHNTVVLPSYGMTECMPISAPPLDFNLKDKVGSSGVSCGPEISIRDSNGKPLRFGKIGNICVRGPPVFHGYEDIEATKEAFFEGKWFNTGDVGYLDEDGYLFITGRSKEVINRGGELISPMEVENAVSKMESVKAVIAISVAHDILQEVVGIAIETKTGYQRPSLPELQSFVSETLNPSKWPQVVIYMDHGVPMTNTNKVQRVDLAKRLCLPVFKDTMSLFERMFEAESPSKGTSVQDLIKCSMVDIFDDLKVVEQIARDVVPNCTDAAALCKWDEIHVFLSFDPGREIPSQDYLLHLIRSSVSEKVPGYSMPSKVVTVTEEIRICDEGWLEKHRPADESMLTIPRNKTEGIVQNLFSSVLGVETSRIPLGYSFFSLGGDSFRAGRFTGLARIQFSLPLQVSALYQHPTVSDFTLHVITEAEKMGLERTSVGGFKQNQNEDSDSESNLKFATRCGNAKSPIALFIQSIPLLFYIPAVRICIWMLFILIFSLVHTNINVHTIYWGVFLLVISGILASIISAIILPLIAICFKWLVIGKYGEGCYRSFGWYYFRWWLVGQSLKFAGKGFFAWHQGLLPWYHRLLGAKIGKNVLMTVRTEIYEHDLVEIGDECVLESCTISPFALLPAAFYLKKIILGRRVIMGPKSIAAPGAVLFDDTFIPPKSSSYEVLNEGITDERTEAEKEQVKKNIKGLFQKPHVITQLLFCYPVLLIIPVIANIPSFAAVAGMISHLQGARAFHGSRTIAEILLWFSYPKRYHWYILIKLASVVLAPFLHLSLSIFLKTFVLGRFKPGKRTNSEYEKVRYFLVEKLITRGPLKEVRMMVGPNHPVVGWIYCLLGAKVGKRVFWPGSGIDIFAEYDLLEIGDDVVFGSRSMFYASSTDECKKIIIQKGAMISDRCVLLPGTNVGANALIGSGTYLPEDFHAKKGSVWLGNDDNGPLIWPTQENNDEDTITPYGRAFFKREASYFVWPLAFHVCVNIVLACLKCTLWILPTISTLYFGVEKIQKARLETTIHPTTGNSVQYPHGVLLETLAIMIAIAMLSYWVLYLVVFAIDIGGKWLIIGRRQVGNYDWDVSSYNQRWQLHKQLQDFRRGLGTRGNSIVAYIQGSQYLVWYFRLLGADIGENVVLYPNGAEPMMTEPDLVSIGDMAGIDAASLVAHINSRGVFDLNSLSVGKGCVMRKNTRLLSGAAMQEFSIMLENTLVVTGDVLGAGTTWQGWPAHQVAASEAMIKGSCDPSVGRAKIHPLA